MTPYERRSKITEYLTENPLTVPQIAALTGAKGVRVEGTVMQHET